MIKLGIAICLVMFLGACDASKTAESDARTSHVKDVKENISRIVYVKDERSGLCFGYIWVGMANGGPGLANVPCEKVEHLLGK